jgi:spoIIIJ-associated protein
MESNSIEMHGRTTDEAIRAALERLGVGREDVDVEVLSEGRSGVFGVGSQEARVRVTLIGDEYDDEEEELVPEALRKEPVRELEDEEDEEVEEDYQPEPGPTAEEAEAARETLEHILDLLEFPNVVTVASVEKDRDLTAIHLDVAGDDVGLLIGRHGETLASVQYLVNACLTKRLPRNTRVMVDIEHYRERREQSLRGVALRTAERVQRERRSVTLQPMPANERRIIHLTLQASPYVSTESTGEGPERRVVVSPKQSTPGRRPSYGGYPRGGYRG